MVANVSRPKGKLFNHMPGDENNALTGDPDVYKRQTVDRGNRRSLPPSSYFSTRAGGKP